MKKQLSIKLFVPSPCHENWEDMTPNERGRHCASCNKTVTDFSLFTDKQLLEYFTGIKEGVCGRFSPFQLERQLVYSEPAKHPFWQKLLFGTALTAGLTTAANAQQTVKHPIHATKGNKKQKKTDPVVEAQPMNITINTQEDSIVATSQKQVIRYEYEGVIGGAVSVYMTNDYFPSRPNMPEYQDILDQLEKVKTTPFTHPHSVLTPKSRDGNL
jgi:hypothetical protein